MGPPAPNGLETLRIRGGYAFLVALMVISGGTLTDLIPDVDPGVFLTLMGGYLATVGAGSVVKLIGGGKG